MLSRFPSKKYRREPQALGEVRPACEVALSNAKVNPSPELLLLGQQRVPACPCPRTHCTHHSALKQHLVLRGFTAANKPELQVRTQTAGFEPATGEQSSSTVGFWPAITLAKGSSVRSLSRALEIKAGHTNAGRGKLGSKVITTLVSLKCSDAAPIHLRSPHQPAAAS